MATFKPDEFLIVTKTYPCPSTRYRELSCVAGINRAGEMRRLFPIPFRLLEQTAQFKKWQWIRANATKAPADHRPESYKVDLDSIVCTDEYINTDNQWRKRLALIEPHMVSGFAELEARRLRSGETLGFMRPARLIGLDIVSEKDKDWTPDELAHLQSQNMFDHPDIAARAPLQKLPYRFYYRYEIDEPGGTKQFKHKITDWEVGALYFTCVKDYGTNWESKLRQKLESDFAQKDLIFLMGTMHRFPDQWLIVGLVYPPKRSLDEGEQLAMEL